MVSEDLRELGLGFACERDYEKAIYFLQKSIDAGNKSALNDIGVVYERMGEYELAFDYYVKASMWGHPTAISNVGNCYLDGMGVNQDIENAIDIFQIAAKKGNLTAFYKLGCIYNVEKYEKYHPGLANHWFERGAKIELEKGKEVGCIMNLSYNYMNSEDEFLREKAFHLLSLAKNLHRPNLNYNLAICYLEGIGTEQDVTKGLELMIESSKGFYYDSFYKLYELFSNGGEEVPLDKELAIQMLDEGIKHDSGRCMIAYVRENLEGNKEACPDHVAMIALGKFYKASFLDDPEEWHYEVDAYNKLKKDFPNAFKWEERERESRSKKEHDA